MVRRIIGLCYAGGIGAGLWFLWPPAADLLRGTWLHDLRIPAVIIYTLFGLWIAERIWAIIQHHFNNRTR